MANKGEGSRGGKIVGHTRSGAPIYQGKTRDKVNAASSAKPQGYKAHTPVIHSTRDDGTPQTIYKGTNNGPMKRGDSDAIGRVKKWENTYEEQGNTYIVEGFQGKKSNNEDYYNVDVSKKNKKSGKFEFQPGMVLAKKKGK